MALTIDITPPPPNTQSAATVRLAGSLDTATAPQLEQQLRQILDSQTREVIFDLAKLEFISSAGLRLFALTRKRLNERGGQVSFVHLQPQIQKVFEIIASLPGMRVFSDLQEMDAYLAKRQEEVRGKSKKNQIIDNS